MLARALNDVARPFAASVSSCHASCSQRSSDEEGQEWREKVRRMQLTDPLLDKVTLATLLALARQEYDEYSSVSTSTTTSEDCHSNST